MLRPPGIEGQVGDGLDELLFADAVVLGVLQVEGELLGVAAGGQRRDREPFSSFGLAGLKNVDGLGEMAGTPGAAA